MTRRLVFGDDRSQAADVAWLWIDSHPWPGWQIEAVTATPMDGIEESGVHAWEPPHPREPRRAGGQPPVIHERMLAPPVVALTGLRDRDLLVVGPKGHGLGKALHLGSVSEALIHDPPMPLVIARHGVPTTRAMVCSDGSADSLAAVEALARMPWIGQVDVLIATVPQRGLDVPAAMAGAADALVRAAASVATQVLTPDDLQIVVNPRAMLLDAARQWQADLVVLGTRGLSGMAALRAGSIATSLASHAPCSVLMARADR